MPKDVAVPISAVPGINLSFRPTTYFGHCRSTRTCSRTSPVTRGASLSARCSRSATMTQYRCRPARSTRPLTLAELVGMIDQAGDHGGPVFSPLFLNIEGGGDAESLRGFVTVSSEFYPQLGAYYAARIEAWFEANVLQEVEAED